MRPHQEVELKVDSFPGHIFKGIVDSVAPGSGSSFAVLPSDNATGNFTKNRPTCASQSGIRQSQLRRIHEPSSPRNVGYSLTFKSNKTTTKRLSSSQEAKCITKSLKHHKSLKLTKWCRTKTSRRQNQKPWTATHIDAEEAQVSIKDWIAVVGSALGAFMAVLDIQITASSLKDIQGALGASLDEGSWISTAYLIAEIVTIPLTGWLSKVFGMKRYIITNAVLFLIFSVFCGMAWDLNSLIAFRAAQGFTGGVLIPMSFAIILSKLPPSKQPIGLAIFQHHSCVCTINRTDYRRLLDR